MSFHYNPAEMSNIYSDIEELKRKAALYDQMVSKGAQPKRLLSDFSDALGDVIEEVLPQFDHPLFINPTTGKVASSMVAVLCALDFPFIKDWPGMCRFMRQHGGASVFSRRDLPKRTSTWPTLCVDLDEVERLLKGFRPRIATTVIATFKAELEIA